MISVAYIRSRTTWTLNYAVAPGACFYANGFVETDYEQPGIPAGNQIVQQKHL